MCTETGSHRRVVNAQTQLREYQLDTPLSDDNIKKSQLHDAYCRRIMDKVGDSPDEAVGGFVER